MSKLTVAENAAKAMAEMFFDGVRPKRRRAFEIEKIVETQLFLHTRSIKPNVKERAITLARTTWNQLCDKAGL
jgi:hypothetical protein